MRLIDIDKIHLDDGWNEEYKKFTSYSGAMIDEAEIVHAIPIEWIVNWLKRRDGHYCYVDLMIEDWEKENAGILQRD